jgi:hypothetical protein
LLLRDLPFSISPDGRAIKGAGMNIKIIATSWVLVLVGLVAIASAETEHAELDEKIDVEVKVS